VYYPVNADFLKSKGAGFGKADKDGILYNGAYLLANFTSKSVIEYDANPSYWDSANVHAQKVKLVYFDGKDVDSLFTNFAKGTYVMAPIHTDNEVVFKQAKKKYKDNIFRSRQDSTCFLYAWNFNRKAYASPADASKGKSPKSAKAKADTQAAIQNRNFRKAFFFGVNRPAILAQRNGEENKLAALRNSYTCPDLATAKDGRDYVKLVEDALKARNPADFGPAFKIDDAQDPYYSPEKAKAFMAKAKAELQAQGVSFPVEIDVPTETNYTIGVKMDQSFKQGIESLFGADTVKVNIVEMDDSNYNASTYLVENGAQCNYDLANTTGWGPDYGDPYAFLQTFIPEEGPMLQNIGLALKADPAEKAIQEKIGLSAYGRDVKAANAEYGDMQKRYKLFARAEAELLDEAIVLPYMSFGGSYAVTRILPYTEIRSPYGTDDDKLKSRVVTNHAVSLAERDKLKAQWTKDKAAAVKAKAK
jgi:ABC-type oligopeptide transport system substrate-binding subunit